MQKLCLVLILIWGWFVLTLPVAATTSPRRGVECRVLSKFYHTLHDQVKSLDQVAVAQQLMFRLEKDMGALNLEDKTLQDIQKSYVTDFHEMGLVFKNIREGQLVGDEHVMERMLPYFQTTATSINSTSARLNDYCKGVWGYKPLPKD